MDDEIKFLIKNLSTKPSEEEMETVKNLYSNQFSQIKVQVIQKDQLFLIVKKV